MKRPPNRRRSSRPRRSLDRYLEGQASTMRVLLWLHLGIYVWALLLSNEVYEWFDIDIEAGHGLSGITREVIQNHRYQNAQPKQSIARGDAEYHE